MVSVCAWCKVNMGVKPPYSDSSTTHGICVSCADNLKSNHFKNSVDFSKKVQYNVVGSLSPTTQNLIGLENGDF